MKTLVLDGRLKQQFYLDPIFNILKHEMESADWHPETILLHRAKIRGCLGCFKCWDTTPGLCIQQKDEAPHIVQKFLRSDLVVFFTPLIFGGYSSELKKMIERMLGVLQPGTTLRSGETHHLKRYEHYPSLLAVGVAENKDVEGERIFKTLIERHSRNFYPPKFRAAVFFSGEEENKVREIIKKIIVQWEFGS